MGRPGLFLRIIIRPFRVQPALLAASMAALTIGAVLASTFLFLYFDLPRKMSGEFKGLGPNLIAIPKGDAQTFPEGIASQLIARHPDVPHASWLYATGAVNGETVIFGGTELLAQARLNPGWQVLGVSPQNGSAESLQDFLDKRNNGAGGGGAADRGKGWLLAGKKVADHFGWHPGAAVHLTYGGRTIELTVTAIVSTGESEDSQLLLAIEDLQTLTGHTGEVSQIQFAVPGSPSDVDVFQRQLASRFPQLNVHSRRQVVESQARVILKIRGFLFGLTAIVLGIVVLTVMTRISGMVLNRRQEIGIMKALGGSDGAISLLFVGETALLSLLAAAVGTVIGFFFAQAAIQKMFQSSLAWRWDVLPAVVLVMLAVTLAASIGPIRLVRRLQPAHIVRGS